MDETLFTIVYWSIGIVIIVLVYLLFVFLRKKLVEWGRRTARNYMDKVDPDLEAMDGEDKKKGE